MAAAAEGVDRFGIGWRDPLAAGIVAELDEFDVIEVIAENCLHASARRLRSLRALGREIPLLLHGVGLGPASVSPVDAAHLDRIARVFDDLDCSGWSEHLSFVRSGGYEIGHLAAPPRNEATIAGAVANLNRLRAVVGAAPAVENIATLMAPPASTCDEPDWVSAIAAAAAVPLLLDLHNLFANAVNFGFDGGHYLRRFPLSRVSIVHISGGVWIDAAGCDASRRLLDDHLHDVPGELFPMLEVLGECCPQPLTIVLERDGRYPSMAVLVEQLHRARAALARGRCRRAHARPLGVPS